MAARRVRAFCRDLGMEEDEAAGVELAVVEAMNNAVLHAYDGSEDGKVELEMMRQPGGELVFAVTDWGRPFDFSAGTSGETVTPEDSAATLAESGRGLMIIGSIMDRLEYASADGANTLRLFKGGVDS